MTADNNFLAEALKGKGIGPEGQRQLKAEQLDHLDAAFLNPAVPDTTKAALITAFLLLENNEIEAAWFARAKTQCLPQSMAWMWNSELALPEGELPTALRQTLLRQDLSEAASIAALNAILDRRFPEWMGGAFLEAQRLKRESYEENKAFLRTLRARARILEINLPLVLDIADNYDGLSRSPQLAPFVAALLAEIGIPTVIHGARELPPKNGLSSRRVLEAGGLLTEQGLSYAAEDLLDHSKGWTYVDQSLSLPELAALEQLRRDMVKRPFLATFEKLLLPIRAQENWLVTGYTHTNYRPLLGKLLDDERHAQRFMVVRGAEGTSRPPLSRKALLVCSLKPGVVEEGELDPAQFGLDLREEAITRWSAEASWHNGLQALSGQNAELADMLLYWASSIVHTLAPEISAEALPNLRRALELGSAAKRMRHIKH